MLCRVVAVLVLMAAAAYADDRTGEVADRVTAAFRDGAAAALQRLAAQDHPDPWLVAEELCFRGARDAAAAFAAAAPRAWKLEKLAAYVASRRGEGVDKETRRALDAAVRLRMGNHGEEAWAILYNLERPGDPVLGIRLDTARAKTLRDLDDHRSSDRHFLHAGKLAHELGWRRRAAATLRYLAFRACLRESSIHSTRRQLKEGEATVGYGSVQGEVLAVLVTTERTTYVPLGETEAIDATYNMFPMPEAGRPVLVDALHKSFIKPLELGPEIRRLFIVSRGFGEVPFVLFAGDREVVYGTSARSVTAFRPWEGDRGQGVLAVALARGAGDTEAEREARAVGDTVLAGEALTHAALKNAFKTRRRWRAVHVAGPSSLAESVFRRWQLARPLRLPRERHEADLLVLSTDASTNVRVRRWESPRQIRSLWRADPEATRVLMTRFYELWNGKAALPACTALKRAQDHVRSHERWKHPYYWAGWQLWASPDWVARLEKGDGPEPPAR